MSPLLLAATLAAAAGAKTYGVLIIAYDADVKWRQELGNLRGQLKGHPVESVVSADAVSLQRAVDRLAAQRVDKIVAVPLETVSASTRLDAVRYLFGARAEPARDVPEPSSRDLADKPLKALHPIAKSALVLPRGAAKRLRGPVPLVLAPALDQSPLLVEMLADRAKALTPSPARETLVLAGIGPRDDAALKAWLASAQTTAAAVGAKAGFRKAVAVAVRDGVRADQRDKDRAGLRAAFRGLIREGRVAVVPLAPEAGRVNELLKKTLGGFFAYRWNGQGIQGDRRLLDWVKNSAAAAAGGTR